MRGVSTDQWQRTSDASFSGIFLRRFFAALLFLVTEAQTYNSWKNRNKSLLTRQSHIWDVTPFWNPALKNNSPSGKMLMSVHMHGVAVLVLHILCGPGGTDLERGTGMCGPEDPLYPPLLQFARVPFQAKESVHKTPF